MHSDQLKEVDVYTDRLWSTDTLRMVQIETSPSIRPHSMILSVEDSAYRNYTYDHIKNLIVLLRF